MRPTSRDYFVLKPKHSGFYDTTLETLLDDLKIRRVIVTGIAGNICVLFTANDAYMRGLKIFAPADCIVSNTVDDNDSALRQIELVLKGDITPSTRLRFGSQPRLRPRSGTRLALLYRSAAGLWRRDDQRWQPGPRSVHCRRFAPPIRPGCVMETAHSCINLDIVRSSTRSSSAACSAWPPRLPLRPLPTTPRSTSATARKAR